MRGSVVLLLSPGKSQMEERGIRSSNLRGADVFKDVINLNT